ncbi:MAG: 5-(carboxyamino)imidazole ribonucleotide mutase [Planctomycetota bacterium]|nr:MAG: 5-(carboxyamino)imidazole ribonucleotide mutase [Planctomycetota bacterium]
MTVTKVAIIIGSDSDWSTMEPCYQELKGFDIPVVVRVISAHRTPEKLREFVLSAQKEGIEVFIAAAGMSAALPGAIAAYTSLPVIGVPIISGALQGIDSLLSMVQMPPGMPVATVAIGVPGAKNAALLAVQILALAQPELGEALKKFKRNMVESVDKKDQVLQERLRRG